MTDPPTDGRKNRYFTLSQASEISGYSTSHLRHLLRAGRLEGVKLGRDWLIMAQDLALVEHRPTGRPRQDGRT